MTIYILGAGPTALAAIDGFSEIANEDIVLIEGSDSVGGLAKTLRWKDYGNHDLGPHKLFTQDEVLLSRVKKLLTNEYWLKRDKVSKIYIKNVYLNYPPAILSLPKVFGLKIFSKMAIDFLVSKIRALNYKKNLKSFEDDLKNRVGQSLYINIFKPIAQKLWGDPNTLDIKLSKGRVQIPSFVEILLNVLGIRKKSKFEALYFWYPKGGLQSLWNAILKKVGAQCLLLLEHRVVKLGTDGHHIKSIICNTKHGSKEINIKKEDYVLSTLPLKHTLDMLENQLSEDLIDVSKQLIQLNDLILVFLYIDLDQLMDESWVFIPEEKYIFHRISEQNSFDPQMVKRGSIVCCEVLVKEISDQKSWSDDNFIDVVTADMKELKFKNFNIIDSKVVRLNKSYPVLKIGYQETLEAILKSLDKFENFRTIGRQGSFNYIGTLDSMDIGYGSSELVSKRLKQQWKSERQRTSFYPVLD